MNSSFIFSTPITTQNLFLLLLYSTEVTRKPFAISPQLLNKNEKVDEDRVDNPNTQSKTSLNSSNRINYQIERKLMEKLLREYAKFVSTS